MHNSQILIILFTGKGNAFVYRNIGWALNNLPRLIFHKTQTNKLPRLSSQNLSTKSCLAIKLIRLLSHIYDLLAPYLSWGQGLHSNSPLELAALNH